MINILELYNKYCKGQQDQAQFNREIMLCHELILHWQSYKDTLHSFVLTLSFDEPSLRQALLHIRRSEVLAVQAQQLFYESYLAQFESLYVFKFNQLLHQDLRSALEFFQQVYQQMLAFLVCFEPSPKDTPSLLLRLAQPFQLFILQSAPLKSKVAEALHHQLRHFLLENLNSLDVCLQEQVISAFPASDQPIWDGRVLIQLLLHTQLLSYGTAVLRNILDETLQQFLSFVYDDSGAVELQCCFVLSKVVLVPFVQRLSSFLEAPHDLLVRLEEYAREKLPHRGFQVFCEGVIFEIMRDYPDTAKVVGDLAESVSSDGKRLQRLAGGLAESIRRRLLIIGVPTPLILQSYINILKILQQVDSRGAVFEKVARPVQEYLLGRKDTLRSIISHLTEDTDNYLNFVQQFIKMPSQHVDLECSSEQLQVEEGGAVVRQESHLKRVAFLETDLMSVLANLYGSQEDFIKEYQNNLALKFLNQKHHHLEEEVKNIELLKQRFGQNKLNNCMILVKDVQDSAKLSNQINKAAQLAFQLQVLVVSRDYWPLVEDQGEEQETNTLVPWLAQAQDTFQTHFKAIQRMRRLHWQQDLGLVHLELDFNGQLCPFKCQPQQAVLITFFDESNYDKGKGMEAGWLAERAGLSAERVRQRMSFWVHKNVVRETSEGGGRVVYWLNEGYMHEEDQQEWDEIEKEEQDYPEANIQGEVLNKILEKKVQVILNNHGPKSMSSLHGLLDKKIYTLDEYLFGIGQPKLQEVLKSMVVNNQLTKYGDTYFLVEPSQHPL